MGVGTGYTITGTDKVKSEDDKEMRMKNPSIRIYLLCVYSGIEFGTEAPVHILLHPQTYIRIESPRPNRFTDPFSCLGRLRHSSDMWFQGGRGEESGVGCQDESQVKDSERVSSHHI